MIENVLVWNGRIADAAPAKGEAIVAPSPTVEQVAESGEALVVRHAQVITIVVAPRSSERSQTEEGPA